MGPAGRVVDGPGAGAGRRGPSAWVRISVGGSGAFPAAESTITAAGYGAGGPAGAGGPDGAGVRAAGAPAACAPGCPTLGSGPDGAGAGPAGAPRSVGAAFSAV